MNETPVRYDATTPRVDRRAFLKLGVAGGAGALVAACGWDGGNAIRPNLLAVSRLNDWAGEKILFPPRPSLGRTVRPSAAAACRATSSRPRPRFSRTRPRGRC